MYLKVPGKHPLQRKHHSTPLYNFGPKPCVGIKLFSIPAFGSKYSIFPWAFTLLFSVLIYSTVCIVCTVCTVCTCTVYSQPPLNWSPPTIRREIAGNKKYIIQHAHIMYHFLQSGSPVHIRIFQGNTDVCGVACIKVQESALYSTRQ